MNRAKPFMSVLISTYNNPLFLEICLESYRRQTYKDFEIIITDDGSDSSTQRLIHQFQKRCAQNIRSIWQEDKGFRLAGVRNLGISAAEGEYLFFTDQDCIAGKELLDEHARLAARGWIRQGKRRLISKKKTARLLTLSSEQAADLDFQNISHPHHFESLFVNSIMLRFGALVASNLSGYKEDFLAAGQFDESYTGWGAEDFDLGFRLRRIKRRLSFMRRGPSVYHLYHPSRRNLFNSNYRLLYRKMLRTSFQKYRKSP